MKLLFYEDAPRQWVLREPRISETGGLKDVPPKFWSRLVYPPFAAYGPEDWPEVEDRPVPEGFGVGKPIMFGTGDETINIYGDDGKPYRFTEGTRKGQMRELKNKMDERFVKNNKAAWKVETDITY